MTGSTPPPFRSRWAEWTPDGPPISATHLPPDPPKPTKAPDTPLLSVSSGTPLGPFRKFERPAKVLAFDWTARIIDALEPDGRGFIAIRRRADGRLLLVVRDAGIEIPAHLAHLPRFTAAEVDQLLSAGAPPEVVRELVRFKDAFPGADIATFTKAQDATIDPTHATAAAPSGSPRPEAPGVREVQS